MKPDMFIGLDRGLNPPEGPTRAACENCGEVKSIEDLNFPDDYWIDHPFCDECWVECCKCGQKDGIPYMHKHGDLWICEDCDECYEAVLMEEDEDD